MAKYTRHPCIDVVNGKPELKIFRFFYKELELPKYKRHTSTIDPDTNSVLDALSRSASTTPTSWEGVNESRMNDDYIKSITKTVKRKWFDRIIDLFVERKKDDVETTFNNIKSAKGELSEDLTKAKEAVEALIQRAGQTNQQALIDKLMERHSVLIAEMVLSQKGHREYVSEEKIIEFFLKCKKGVRIDFIRNYTSLIPFPVAEKKTEADKLMVFDNYYIMHYDPNVEAFAVSSSDRAAAKKRDPILFGMIEGSRRLYYIADWITDDDTLTLEELNLVVDNATSRLAKFEMSMPTMDDIVSVLENIEPVDGSR